MNPSDALSERYAGRRVLVTGGSGFIGGHLCRRLADLGAHVTSLSRSPMPPLHPLVESEAGDIRDEQLVSRLVTVRFDFVFHLAAYSGQVPGFTDHEQSLTTNCLGQLNLLEAIRLHSPATRLCLASSRLVYGRTPRLPVGEDHQREPLSFYGIHKRTAEDYCHYYGQRWGVESVVVRMSNPYGPHPPAGHSRYNVANWMIDRIVAGDEVPVFGRGTQLRDYIYVTDAVDAMLLAASQPAGAGRVYNVGSGAGTELIAFVEQTISSAAAGRYRFLPWPHDALQVETGDYAADISRIREDAGWSPRVSLRDGIAMTVAAARQASVQPVEVAA